MCSVPLQRPYHKGPGASNGSLVGDCSDTHLFPPLAQARRAWCAWRRRWRGSRWWSWRFRPAPTPPTCWAASSSWSGCAACRSLPYRAQVGASLQAHICYFAIGLPMQVPERGPRVWKQSVRCYFRHLARALTCVPPACSLCAQYYKFCTCPWDGCLYKFADAIAHHIQLGSAQWWWQALSSSLYLAAVCRILNLS